jgi:hypothetical protein
LLEIRIEPDEVNQDHSECRSATLFATMCSFLELN